MFTSGDIICLGEEIFIWPLHQGNNCIILFNDTQNLSILPPLHLQMHGIMLKWIHLKGIVTNLQREASFADMKNEGYTLRQKLEGANSFLSNEKEENMSMSESFPTEMCSLTGAGIAPVS